jgi:acyl carrier protein
VLDEVRRMLAELGSAGVAALAADARLDRDLGFDSLALVELIARLEQRFDVSLPDEALSTVETPADLAGLVAAVSGPATGPPPPDSAPSVGTAGAPEPSIDLAGTGPLPDLASAATLIDVLEARAGATPGRIHLHVLGDPDRTVTYGELRTGAAAVARGLAVRHGVEPGETVALMLPTSAEYFTTFLGVLLAGAVPMPVYPPTRPSQLEDHLRRHVRILDNAQAVLLVTVPEAVRVGRLLRGSVPSLRRVLTPAGLPAGDSPDARPRVGSSDLALIQYTSGSTGDPKGVALTHANLLANIQAMAAAAEVDEHDVFVSWLPLYHDMGLIGAWLGSLTAGFPLVVMSPLSFLARPARWLRAILEHGGTLSAAPNFGYELCLTKVTDEELDGVNLSGWRMAFNGAEPVSPATIERFTARFAVHGFRPTAMAPVYGLAENSVGLTFPPPGRGPRIDRIDRHRFLTDGRAVPVEDPAAMPVVGCGSALPGHRVRVVDATGAELGDRREGRIEFRGPSATAGYFRNPEATARLRRDGWLDTGDLGYLAEGELFVTGRVKDLIIRGGRNLHPEELELAVGQLSGIRRGRVAVFGVEDPATGTERLVVEAETTERDPAAREELRRSVVAGRPVRRDHDRAPGPPRRPGCPWRRVRGDGQGARRGPGAVGVAGHRDPAPDGLAMGGAARRGADGAGRHPDAAAGRGCRAGAAVGAVRAGRQPRRVAGRHGGGRRRARSAVLRGRGGVLPPRPDPDVPAAAGHRVRRAHRPGAGGGGDPSARRTRLRRRAAGRVPRGPAVPGAGTAAVPPGCVRGRRHGRLPGGAIRRAGHPAHAPARHPAGAAGRGDGRGRRSGHHRSVRLGRCPRVARGGPIRDRGPLRRAGPRPAGGRIAVTRPVAPDRRPRDRAGRTVRRRRQREASTPSTSATSTGRRSAAER